MIWYVFDMTGFSEPIRLSLTRAFMRSTRREDSDGDSRLYAAYLDHEVTPATYYLRVLDERSFGRLIRQFGGRRCAPPPPAQLQEVKKESGPMTSTPEADTAPC